MNFLNVLFDFNVVSNIAAVAGTILGIFGAAVMIAGIAITLWVDEGHPALHANGGECASASPHQHVASGNVGPVEVTA